MASLNTISVKRKLRVIVHGLGLSSLGSALFLQSVVFSSILQKGYFKGIEQNHIILNSEIALTGFAIAYFGYMFVRFIFSNKQNF
jgi:NhaP-type Na+/H+ or K+/H+ antiporter